jgi:tetratricopeptide (TPR) repeat protein
MEYLSLITSEAAMIKNDYIMRMIEQIAAIAASIIGLKREKKHEEIQLIMDDAFKRFLGLNLQSVDMLSYRDIVNIISTSEKVDPGKLLILGELLKQQADLYDARGKSEKAYTLYLKSIQGYMEALLMDSDFCSEKYISEIDEIISILKPYEIPDGVKELLFKYYERTGEYGKAEDTLFEQLEDSNYDGRTIENGIAFYERLMDKDREELIKGNLPMQEVMEGYSKLKEHKK